jgi:hypothetical protein
VRLRDPTDSSSFITSLLKCNVHCILLGFYVFNVSGQAQYEDDDEADDYYRDGPYARPEVFNPTSRTR